MSKPFEVLSLKVHSDERGSLFEIMRFLDQKIPGQGYLYCFSVNPGQRRGDHYHEKKKEWFTCVSGKVKVLLESDDRVTEVILDSTKPELIFCAPRTVHAVLNESESPALLVSYGSIQHSSSDPDTFKKFING